MATTKKEGVQEPVIEAAGLDAAQQPPVQSARERYRSRYQQNHPDLNLDDEEAFYGQANANLDELENFRNSNEQLGAAFDRTPLLAGLVLAAKEGENPFVYLAENVGPDMDIRELANNEEFGQKMGDALMKFEENRKKAEETDAASRKEIGENVQKSFAALKELQEEKGLSNEDCVALVKKLLGEVDDEGNPTELGIIGNASKGIIPKEVWESVLKAQNYDADIQAASDKARAAALNERVQNGLRGGGSGLPSLGSGGAGREEPKKKKGGFADFGME